MSIDDALESNGIVAVKAYAEREPRSALFGYIDRLNGEVRRSIHV
jgi:hypothetical protein